VFLKIENSITLMLSPNYVAIAMETINIFIEYAFNYS